MYQNISTAFEFSKRKFSQTYGPDLPVWALLASGSTGGVRLYLLMLLTSRLNTTADRLLALFLPSR